MQQDTYNGWSNHSTWLVKLWIDNDAMMQEYMTELAQCYYGSSLPTPHQTRFDVATRELESVIEEIHQQAADELLPESGVMRDLMNSALDEVNWREIADSFMEYIGQEAE